MRVRSLLACFAAALAVGTHQAADAQKLLVRGGTVVNADREFKADVLISGGKIEHVAESIEPTADVERIIEAKGMYVMPGGIDPHTHLAMPFMGTEAADDFRTGQEAALAGGTTLHIDFVLPVNGSLLKGYELWEHKAKRSVMDYAFHVAVDSWKEEFTTNEMEVLVKEKGVNSFKFFLAYKGTLMVSDAQLIRGLSKCKELGALAMIHAENGDAVHEWQNHVFNDLGITGPEGHALSRPAYLEEEATMRAIALARLANVPLYIVHVMSKGAMEAVARARAEGQRVVGEPTVAGLTLDESRLWHEDFLEAAKFVMSPPIRKLDVDGNALQLALKNGIMSVVATDHAVFTSKQKLLGQHDFRKIPNGVNGLEERIPVLWTAMVNTGHLSPSEFVRVTSTEAAKIFNLYPQKGLIRDGSDADLYLLDPSVEYTISARTHHSAIDTNVFEGFHLKGKVVTTISRGRVLWHDNKLHTANATGRFIPTPPYSPYMYRGMEEDDSRRRREMRAPVQRKHTSHKKEEL